MTDERYINGYREYNIDGNWLPSVTSIINSDPKTKSFIDKWKEKVGEKEAKRISTQSMELGSLIHYNFCQKFCKNSHLSQELPEIMVKPDYYKKLKKYKDYLIISNVLIDRFLDLMGDSLEVINIERKVSNLKYGFAGRLDIQGYLIEGENRIPIILDIKTGKRVYESTSYQLSAYNYALNGFAKRLFVLHLPIQTNNPKIKMVKMNYDFEGFLKLRDYFYENIRKK